MGRLSDSTTGPARHRNAPALLQVSGLIAAGFASFVGFPMPSGHTLSWSRLLGSVFEQAFTVSLVSVVTVVALSPLVLRGSGPDFVHLARRASVNALWLAPLVLFARADSFWTLPLSAVLSVIITTSFDTERETTDADSFLSSLFAVDAIPLASRFALQRSSIAALFLEVGILIAFDGHTISGALIVALGCAVWAWSSSTHLRDSAEPSRPKPVLTLSLVTLLMVAGLIPYLQHGGGRGSIAAHLGPFPDHPNGGNSKQGHPNLPTQWQDGPPSEGGERGIILWGKEKSYTQLVAPSPVLSSSLTSRGTANPLVIPFDGVYWFFKSPDLRPPVGSQQAHTTPEVVDIRSTDRRPLSIEALDHLANLINLDCCSRFQIAIRNADRYPETVSLKLELVDTTLPHTPSVSLGQMMVSSTHAWRLFEKPGVVNETLSFPIPIRRTVKSFDEIKVIFLLDRARADAGARIAIDHFVLVPRGF